MSPGPFHLDDFDSNAQIRYAYNRLHLATTKPNNPALVTAASREIDQLIAERTVNNGRESIASKRERMRKLYFKGTKRSIFKKMMQELGL